MKQPEEFVITEPFEGFGESELKAVSSTVVYTKYISAQQQLSKMANQRIRKGIPLSSAAMIQKSNQVEMLGLKVLEMLESMHQNERE